MQHGNHRCSLLGHRKPIQVGNHLAGWFCELGNGRSLLGTLEVSMEHFLRSEIIYLKMDQGSCVRKQLPGSHQTEKGCITWRGRLAPGRRLLVTPQVRKLHVEEKQNPLERLNVPGQVPRRKATLCSCDPLSKMKKETDDSAPTFLLETLCPWEPAAAAQ